MGFDYKNRYSLLSNLKSRIVGLARGKDQAYFFASGSFGDRAIFYSYLDAFRSLTGLQPVILSIDKSDPLVELFPSVSGRSLVIPMELIGDCPVGFLPWALGDASPGEERIYFTGCAYYLDGRISDSWLKKNSREFNVFSLTKLILGLPESVCPQELSFDALMSNVSGGFVMPVGRYIVLAPHSSSCPELLPIDFWLPMVKKALAGGFLCIVNLPSKIDNSGWSSPDVAALFRACGAVVFSGDFLDLLALCLGAFHVVTTRSGVADLLNLSPRSRYSVVYPPCFSHITEYFGLRNSSGFPPFAELLVQRLAKSESVGLALLEKIINIECE